MIFRRTLHFFAGHLIPRRRMQYFREYLDEVGAINQAARLGADAERRHVTAKHWAVIVFLLVQSSHQLWLLLAFPADLTDRELLLHYDVPVIEFGNVMFNAVWTAFGPLCVTLSSIYYLQSDDRILAMLHDILFRRRCELFASDRFAGTTPYDYLRRRAITIISRFHIFIYLIHFIVIYLHFHTMLGAFESLNISFDDSPFDLFLYRLNGIKYHAFMYEFANILILAGTIGEIVVWCHFVMFKQANQVLLLGRCKHGKLERRLAFDWRRFHRFRRYFIDALRHFLYANAWTGKSFAAFLIVNFPLNAYLVMFLLVADLPRTKKLGPMVLVVGQLLILLGMHLAFTMFSSLIHRPSKPLIRLMVRQYRRSTKRIARNESRLRPLDYVRDQIQLSLCIDALHTTKRYGKTYGKLGLITVSTFTKCMMLYGKFLMKSYKNIRKIK